MRGLGFIYLLFLYPVDGASPPVVSAISTPPTQHISQPTPDTTQPTTMGEVESNPTRHTSQPTSDTTQPTTLGIVEPNPTKHTSQPTSDTTQPTTMGVVEPNPTQHTSQPTSDTTQPTTMGVVEPNPTQHTSQPTSDTIQLTTMGVVESNPTRHTSQPTSDTTQPTTMGVVEPNPTQHTSQPTFDTTQPTTMGVMEPNPTQNASQPTSDTTQPTTMGVVELNAAEAGNTTSMDSAVSQFHSPEDLATVSPIASSPSDLVNSSVNKIEDTTDSFSQITQESLNFTTSKNQTNAHPHPADLSNSTPKSLETVTPLLDGNGAFGNGSTDSSIGDGAVITTVSSSIAVSTTTLSMAPTTGSSSLVESSSVSPSKHNVISGETSQDTQTSVMRTEVTTQEHATESLTTKAPFTGIVICLLQMQGNCSLIESYLAEQDFMQRFDAWFNDILNETKGFQSGNFSCINGSVAQMTVELNSAKLALLHGALGKTINITLHADMVQFMLLSFATNASQRRGLKATTNDKGTLNQTRLATTWASDNTRENYPKDTSRDLWGSLSEQHKIVIIVCGVIGGTLVMLAVIFLCRTATHVTRTKSFNLGRSSYHVEVGPKDYTLTRMERPKMVYNSDGTIEYADTGTLCPPVPSPTPAGTPNLRYTLGPEKQRLHRSRLELAHEIDDMIFDSESTLSRIERKLMQRDLDDGLEGIDNPLFVPDEGNHVVPPMGVQLSNREADSQSSDSGVDGSSVGSKSGQKK